MGKTTGLRKRSAIQRLTPDEILLLRKVDAGDPDDLYQSAINFLGKRPEHPLGLKALSYALIYRGEHEQAISVLERAIKRYPHDWELFHNLAVALHSLMRWDEMVRRLEEVRLVFSKQPEFWKTLGTALSRSHRWNDAVPHLMRAIELCTEDDFEAIAELGNTLLNANRFDEAYACLNEVFLADPTKPDVLATLIFCRLRNCDWLGVDEQLSLLREISKGFSTFCGPPFFTLPFFGLDNADLCKITRSYAETQIPVKIPRLRQDKIKNFADSSRRIRVGYISGDFRDHPVGYVVGEVIARHDRERFDVFGYSTHPSEDTKIAGELRRSFDHFREVHAIPTPELAENLLADQLDILVDFTGWTAFGRTAVLAYRPAAVLVNWIGYAGTMGHPIVADYLIADNIVIKKEDEHYFSEEVVRLSGCYLPFDTRHPLGAMPGRDTYGLPAGVPVFCSFNNGYKYNPEVIKLWCDILKEVPGSVFWLGGVSRTAAERVRDTCVSHGIESGRIIVADRVESRPAHLARLQMADIALDPFPYNSHSTGLEMLWAGVPMVSMLGKTFAGRVGGSMLQTVGLNELVAADKAEYFRIAVLLAKDAQYLQRIKEKLAHGRSESRLFNMRDFVAELEEKYIDFVARPGKQDRD